MRAALAAGLLLCLGLSACIYVVRVPLVEDVPANAPSGTMVQTPVKVHLLDGSTVVYQGGVRFDRDTLRGTGQRYDLRLEPVGSAATLPLDSVAGLETYRSRTNFEVSLLASLAATGLTALAGMALLVAIFGSCPTVYAEMDGTAVLEAESFSYSIAPLFESRDVDRLLARPGADGVLRLEVRNEALETHFINHMELLEVPLSGGDEVLPDAQGVPLLVRGVITVEQATDRAGRDVASTLATADAAAYETPDALMAAASVADMRDYIDLVFPAPVDTDSAAVLLRLRNSLLTTILLYDVMLGSQGAAALQWLGSALDQVGGALEVGQWYNRNMGLRVYVLDDGAYREAGRLGDTGPIAWKDVAVVVPVPAGDSLRLRLSFVSDAWRIDRVSVAAAFERPAFRTIPVSRVSTSASDDEVAARRALTAPDEHYLETTPGHRFFMHFETGHGAGSTYLLAAQGYYSEWIRPSWIRGAAGTPGFTPSEGSILEALARWRSQRDTFERQFYETRIPVR